MSPYVYWCILCCLYFLCNLIALCAHIYTGPRISYCNSEPGASQSQQEARNHCWQPPTGCGHVATETRTVHCGECSIPERSQSILLEGEAIYNYYVYMGYLLWIKFRQPFIIAYMYILYIIMPYRMIVYSSMYFLFIHFSLKQPLISKAETVNCCSVTMPVIQAGCKRGVSSAKELIGLICE